MVYNIYERGKRKQKWETYHTSNCALIHNYIIHNFGAMRFSDFTPQTLGSIHRIMHSAFEQAVLWEYIEQNPFHKVALPKAYPGTPDMLLPENVSHLMQECSSPELLLGRCIWHLQVRCARAMPLT